VEVEEWKSQMEKWKSGIEEPSIRIAQKKPGRKGILKGNSSSKPKAKTNSSEQAWNYNPGFFLGDDQE
jgi:hypothetical protein